MSHISTLTNKSKRPRLKLRLTFRDIKTHKGTAASVTSTLSSEVFLISINKKYLTRFAAFFAL